MEWNINDITEQASLNAQAMVQQWKEAAQKRLFREGGKKPTKHTPKSFSRTDIQNNKKRFLAQLNEAIKKHPEFNTPQWIQYFTTIADVETGGTFNENATSKTSSARGYFQLLKDNRKTGNQFEDMFALTKQNQKNLLNGLGEEGITQIMQSYTVPEIMALSHFQGANGAMKIFRGGKGFKDANGVSPDKYLNIFKSRIGNKQPIASIEEQTKTIVNPNLPLYPEQSNMIETPVVQYPTMETPLTALQIAQEYNSITPQTPISTPMTTEELEIPKVNIISNIAGKKLLGKAISQTLGLQTSLPQTIDPEVAFDPRIFIDNTNQSALGGPLFNSRTPIESFQGKKTPLPVVRYNEGGKIQRNPVNMNISSSTTDQNILSEYNDYTNNLLEQQGDVNYAAQGGNLFLLGGSDTEGSIIRQPRNRVYNNYEDAVDNNMGPIMTRIRKGLRYIKDNINDSIPAGISNCTLTATQWIDPTNPIMSAKTIVSNPASVGYSKISTDQAVPGDLLIAKVPGKDSYHTMYVSGFDKEGKPLLDYSRGGIGIEENLKTNIPLEWYTANSDGHTQNLYYRNNKFAKSVLPEVIVTGKKKAEGGNLFYDGGNNLLTQNLPDIVVTRPYPSEQQIKQTIEKEWPSAIGLPQYRITKDPTFTRERTGAGSIEYFNEPSITYRNGTTVQNPNQEPTLLFDPNTNTVEDIKLDLLHHYREYDKEYQKLLLDYTNALVGNRHTASDLFWNSELGEQYRNKYGKDIEKHWDEWDQMVEENINNDQYLTQAIDGSLRSLMASDALRQKSNYDTKEGAESSWLKDKYARRAYNNIVKYLRTSKK